MTELNKIQGKIWFNGKIVEWGDANIHILTHGLHYGSSVYEGIRVYNGNAFKIEEHIERFHASAKCIGISIPFSTEELIAAANEQIKLNNIIDGYVRPVAWRGSETMLIGGVDKSAEVAIAVWKIFENREDLRRKGIKLCLSKWCKPAPNASPYTAKTAGVYTLATMVKNEAVARGFDDALMLDSDGNITEATTSNLFFIFGNELHTPIPDCFLNGITRQTIIALAKKLGIKVHERKIKFEELLSENKAFQNGAFLTGTAIEIMPVQLIEDVEFDINNPILRNLAEHYAKEVRTTK